MSLEIALERIKACKEKQETRLDLSKMELQVIPYQLLELNQLTSLDLSENQINQIITLDALSNLSSLNLSSNQISKIEGLNGLTKLNELKLGKNQLTKIEGVSSLVNLRAFSLNENQIIKLENLGNLLNLNSLDLMANKIVKIEGLRGLNKLTGLYLSINKIKKIEGLEDLVNLTYLHLSANEILKIENIDHLSAIEYLYIWSNKITKLDGIKKLNNLELLDIGRNPIEKIEKLNEFSKLRHLDLEYTGRTSIEGVDICSTLEVLVLSRNEITSIGEVKNLTRLRRLDIDNNKIVKIENIDKLKELQILNLSRNNIDKIEGIKDLQNLKDFDISYNPINYLDELVEIVDTLQKLKINGTPLEAGYGIVLNEKENHIDTIRNIVNREAETGKVGIDLPAKVLLLGNHASGKSSLLHYLLEGNLEHHGDSTHILEVKKYPKMADFPNAFFYDFGGQDYYHGIYRAFLSAGSAYLLLWKKATNNNTSESDEKKILTQNFNLRYWLGQKEYLENEKFKTKAPDPILLIQTHAQEKHGPINPTAPNGLGIRNTFYLSLSESYNPDKNKLALQYLNAEIDELIKEKEVHREEPNWYKTFLENIINAKGYEATNLDELLKIYTPSKMKDPRKSLEAELLQLNNQGLVLYHPEVDKEVVWLNPQDLVEYVHDKVLTKENLKGNVGTVDHNTFKPFDQKLIKLLQSQKVIFEHKHKKEGPEYIIPNFLPLARESEAEYDLITFGLDDPLFILRFSDFIPIGIINQLICLFGEQPNEKKFWRDQLLFVFENKCKVLIRLNFELLEIKVYATFIDRSFYEKDDVSKYLFYALISLYWDFDILNYKEFIEIVKNEIKDDTERTSNIKKDSLKKVYEDIHYRPKNLKVSRDDKHFVNYSALLEHDISNSRITGYIRGEGDALIPSTKEIPVKPFEIFTNNRLAKMKSVFISYSKDDIVLVNRFIDALTPLHDDGLIQNPWYCTKLEAGSKWDTEIQKKLAEADIAFFMCSMSFLRTEYIKEHEIKTALESKNSGKPLTIIPVVLNFCEWEKYFDDNKYTALPYTAKPVTDFKNQDAAWYLTAKAIRVVLEGGGEENIKGRVRELYERLKDGGLNA